MAGKIHFNNPAKRSMINLTTNKLKRFGGKSDEKESLSSCIPAHHHPGPDPEEPAGVRAHRGAQVQRRRHHEPGHAGLHGVAGQDRRGLGHRRRHPRHSRQHLPLAVRNERLRRRLHPRHERPGGAVPQVRRRAVRRAGLCRPGQPGQPRRRPHRHRLRRTAPSG